MPVNGNKNTETMIRGATTYRNADGFLHRTNGPAVIREDGYKAYWVNGVRHRVGGPAIIRADGKKFWYLNGDLKAVSRSIVEDGSDPESVWIGRGVKIIEKDREDKFTLNAQLDFEF